MGQLHVASDRYRAVCLMVRRDDCEVLRRETERPMPVPWSPTCAGAMTSPKRPGDPPGNRRRLRRGGRVGIDAIIYRGSCTLGGCS